MNRQEQHPGFIAKIALGIPFRNRRSLWLIYHESGLFRSLELKSGLLWKLDSLHEALILQILRERRSAVKAQLGASKAYKDPATEEKYARELERIHDVMVAIGNRPAKVDEGEAS